MAKIRRNDKREMPALNTSSLPDIIFMLLFFFMSVTSMKEVSYKVQFKNLRLPSSPRSRTNRWYAISMLVLLRLNSANSTVLKPVSS